MGPSARASKAWLDTDFEDILVEMAVLQILTCPIRFSGLGDDETNQLSDSESESDAESDAQSHSDGSDEFD